MKISPTRVIWCQTSKSRIFEIEKFLGLFEQVVRHVSDELPNLERLLLNQLRALERLRRKLFKLHQLGVGQYHADTIV